MTNGTIWKFEIPLRVGVIGAFEIEMPYGARAVSVAIQDGKPTLWALVETDMPPVPHAFYLAGTGQPVPGNLPIGQSTFVGTYQIGRYIGDVLTDWFVGHLFQLGATRTP